MYVNFFLFVYYALRPCWKMQGHENTLTTKPASIFLRNTVVNANSVLGKAVIKIDNNGEEIVNNGQEMEADDKKCRS